MGEAGGLGTEVGAGTGAGAGVPTGSFAEMSRGMRATTRSASVVIRSTTCATRINRSVEFTYITNRITLSPTRISVRTDWMSGIEDTSAGSR
jgi:hypothetical protein